MFCIKICFLEPEPVRAELLRAEPEHICFYLEPEPKKKYLNPEPRKKWLGCATMLKT